jgi:hypothetical protein
MKLFWFDNLQHGIRFGFPPQQGIQHLLEQLLLSFEYLVQGMVVP